MAPVTRKPREWTPEELAAAQAWADQQAARGMCPHAGLPLLLGEDGRSRCGICDCAGWPPVETGEPLPPTR